MNIRAWLVACAALFCLSGCPDSHSSKTLTVKVITDLVAGPEFNRLQTELFVIEGDSERKIDQADSDAYFGLPFSRGVTVATFREAPLQELIVRVRAFTPQGSMLVEQNTRFALNADFTVTVFLDRECIAVQCPAPGGSAAYTACIAGTCADPRCQPNDPSTRQYCPEIDFCNEAADCSPVAACAEQSCEQGVCIAKQRAHADSDATTCPAAQYCDPDVDGSGCSDVPASTRPLDGGVADGGLICGTVCFFEGNACVVGYWDCPDASAPVCTGFIFAASGTPCGADDVCDGSGTCAPATTMAVTPENTFRVEEGAALRSAIRYTIDVQTSLTAPLPVRITSETPTVCTVPITAGPQFSAGSPPQDVTITVVEDSVFTDTRTCTLRFELLDITVTRSFTIRDDDTLILTRSRTGGTLSYPTLSGDAQLLPAFSTAVSASVTEAGFSSFGSNVTLTSDTNAESDVFFWHANGDPTTMISLNAAGTQASDRRSMAIGFLSNDQELLYTTTSTDTGFSPINSNTSLLAYNTSTHSRRQIDLGSIPVPANGILVSGARSTTIALNNSESVFGISDSNGKSDVYAVDVSSVTPQVELVSSSASSPTTTGNGISCVLAMDSSGRYISFFSASTDLVDGLTETGGVYVRDLQEHRTYGTRARYPVSGPDTCVNRVLGSGVSAATGTMIFSSTAGGYIPGDVDEPTASGLSFDGADVFLWHWATGVVTPLSVRSDGSLSNGGSLFVNMSNNGRYVAFVTTATDLLASGSTPPTGSPQTVLFDLETGAKRYVSQRGNGTWPSDQNLIPLGIADDGEHIIAISWITGSSTPPNLVYISGF